MLVQITVCKFHPKFTPGGAEIGTSAGGEGQEYEEMDGRDKGGVAVSDPTYMEVDGGGGGGRGTPSNSRRMKHTPALYTNNHAL